MWEFETDAKSREFAAAIVDRICTLFSVTPEEAIAAINKGWRGMDFRGEPHIYYHETIDYWANTHFLGTESGWWLPDAEREEHVREFEELTSRLRSKLRSDE